MQKNNVLEYQKLQCKMGIKAFQNISSALEAINYLLAMELPRDYIPVAALFQNALVLYCKPFINSKMDGKNIQYRESKLTSNSQFDRQLHEHIKHLRHTLLAHDDFDEIAASMFTAGLKFTDPNKVDITFYPASSVLINKQLLFPNDLAFIEKIRAHFYLSAQIVYSELESDVKKYGDLALEHQEELQNSGSGFDTIPTKILPEQEISIPHPEHLGLVEEPPKYEIADNGYCYAVARYTSHHQLPETHTCSNGTIIKLERVQ